MSNASQFLSLVNSPLKFRLFLLAKLPSAFFCGVRVRSADEEKCVVTVPFKWLSQNPFRSTYFACLAMAHIYKRNPAVSMLVLDVKGNFIKKATGKTRFTCEDGSLIRQSIEEAIGTGDGRIVTARSAGRNESGEVVAEFTITWSFKVKPNSN